MKDVRAFEWDEAKRLANFEKHGIDFEDIGPAFDDGCAFHVPDRRVDYGEERIIMLAHCQGLILAIVYTLRGEKTRLISARLANQRERAVYERYRHDAGLSH